MSEILLKGGRLIDPASGVDRKTDILIAEGRVKSIGETSNSAEVIDIEGTFVMPGLVDMHTHLREPGREDEETIATGSAAAAAGGYTALQSMPNTDPVCDNASVAELIYSQGLAAGLVELVPSGAITRGLNGVEIAPIGEMVRSSARVRMFTDDGRGVQDALLLRRAMEYIRGFGAICAEHCEDDSLSQGGHMNEGEVSEILGLKGIPPEAEEIALARDLALAKLTGVRFHVLHVSTAGSAELIQRAKAEGVNVTAEVTPHHLTLTDALLVDYDTNLKVNPPLRTESDVGALGRALAEGVIDVIATDHAPHSPEEKEGEFELAPPGMLGLETALSVIYTELVEGGVVSLEAVVRAMSVTPARILGLAAQGGPVEPGAPANLTVFDPSAKWTVDPGKFASPVRNSPWIGRELTGRVLHTVFQGRFTLRDGKLTEGVPA